MLKQATETGKGIAGFYFELGNTLMNCSGPEEARRYYERVLLWTTDPAIQSMYLQCRLLSPGETNASLLEANRNWATIYEPSDALPATHQRDRDPNRRLKIGYICSFFSNTVMRNGYVDLLRLHDRAAFEVFCYNDGDLPEGIKDCADHWRMVRGLSVPKKPGQVTGVSAVISVLRCNDEFLKSFATSPSL